MKKILILALILSSFSLFAASNPEQVSKANSIFQNVATCANAPTVNNKTYVICYDSSNKIVGYFISLQAKGVSDTIKFDLGIDTNGKIAKIANIDIGHNKSRYNKTVLDKKWQDMWIGRDKNYSYNDKLDGTAGASVSPRVIYEAVKSALESFKK